MGASHAAPRPPSPTRRPIPAPRAHELEDARWAWRPTPSVALGRGPSKLSRVLVAHPSQPLHLASLLVRLVLCAWATGGWGGPPRGSRRAAAHLPQGLAGRLQPLSFSKPSEEFLNGADFLTAPGLRGLHGPGAEGWGGPCCPSPPQVGPNPGRPSVTELRVFQAPPAPVSCKRSPEQLVNSGDRKPPVGLRGAAHLWLPVFVWVEIIRPISL